MKTFYILSLRASRVIITLIDSIYSELWKVLNQFLLYVILKAQKSPLFQKRISVSISDGRSFLLCIRVLEYWLTGYHVKYGGKFSWEKLNKWQSYPWITFSWKWVIIARIGQILCSFRNGVSNGQWLIIDGSF